ncbi:hypothetical protein NKH77_12210 [Streptomyces sp. M19]
MAHRSATAVPGTADGAAAGGAGGLARQVDGGLVLRPVRLGGPGLLLPQGFTYLLYLVFVAVLLVWFREPRMLRGRRWPGEAEVADATPAQRTALLGLLIALFAAAVAAHQLTPFVMLGVATALVLARRSTLRGLPLLGSVMVAAWVGILAEPYWSGHFQDLFGGVGGVGGNVSSSVSGRIEGGSSVHKLVLYTRVALAGGCWRSPAGVLRRRAADSPSARCRCSPSCRSSRSACSPTAARWRCASSCSRCPARARSPRWPCSRRCPGTGRPGTGAGAGAVRRPDGGPGAGAGLPGGPLGQRAVRAGAAGRGRGDGLRVRARRADRARAVDDRRPVVDVTPAMPWGARDMERVGYVPRARRATRRPWGRGDGPAGRGAGVVPAGQPRPVGVSGAEIGLRGRLARQAAALAGPPRRAAPGAGQRRRVAVRAAAATAGRAADPAPARRVPW